MALLKCPECNQEVSSNAVSCPHCGNPNIVVKQEPVVTTSPTQSEPVKIQKPKSKLVKNIIGSLIFLVSLVVAYEILRVKGMANTFSPTFNKIFSFSPGQSIADEFSRFRNKINEPITRSNAGLEMPAPAGTDTLEKNDIFGYQFYTGKIDGSESIDIGSANKQAIANLLKSLNYPHSLTPKLAILIVDPAASKPTDRLVIPWAGGNASIQLQTQVGSYQGVYGGSVIIMNNLTGINIAVLTHELGHYISNQMTEAEWSQYYKLRGIPSTTPRNSANWNQSVSEDFAEVYKNTYRQSASEEWNVNTEYGTLVPVSDFLEFSAGCYAIKDSEELQSCRQKNRYATSYGMRVYTVQVSEGTKQFLRNLVARLR